MKLEFLCGCMTGDVIDPDNLRTMNSVTLDEEAFLICQIHRSRRKNWRGDKITVSTEQRLALEHLEVYGWSEDISDTPLNINFATEDRRDNSDPEMIGLKILAGFSNLKLDRFLKESKNGKVDMSGMGLDLLKRNRGL